MIRILRVNFTNAGLVLPDIFVGGLQLFKIKAFVSDRRAVGSFTEIPIHITLRIFFHTPFHNHLCKLPCLVLIYQVLKIGAAVEMEDLIYRQIAYGYQNRKQYNSYHRQGNDFRAEPALNLYKGLQCVRIGFGKLSFG